MIWKPALRKVHLVFALASMLPLAVVGATGSLLAFPRWLESQSVGISFEVPTSGTRLSPSQVVAAMNRALPADDPADRLVFPLSDDGVITSTTRGGRFLAVHPHTGDVLALREDSRSSLYRIVLGLHVNLMAGSTGTWIVALSAVALTVLSISGLFLWWPVGRWRGAYFKVAWHKGWRRANYDLHRNVGAYACVILFLIGLTGMAMAFHSQTTRLLHFVLRSTPLPMEARVVTIPPGASQISSDDAVAAAMQAVPGMRLYRLYPPSKPDAPFRVFLNPPENWNSRTEEARLVIDPYTRSILSASTTQTRSRGDQALMWVLPLHFGTFAGTPSQGLYLAASLTPLLLSATGTTIWLARRRKQTRAAKFASKSFTN